MPLASSVSGSSAKTPLFYVTCCPYRSLSDSASRMAKDLAQQQAESDLGEQFSEFSGYMQQGELASVCITHARDASCSWVMLTRSWTSTSKTTDAEDGVEVIEQRLTA